MIFTQNIWSGKYDLNQVIVLQEKPIASNLPRKVPWFIVLKVSEEWLVSSWSETCHQNLFSHGEETGISPEWLLGNPNWYLRGCCGSTPKCQWSISPSNFWQLLVNLATSYCLICPLNGLILFHFLLCLLGYTIW